MSDRYAFDFKTCVPSKGWAQLDTDQDASYYGNWVNPITFELVSYCEGDITRTKCANEEEFKRELRATIQWHAERDYNPKIDGMMNETIIKAFKRLGFENCLH
jgi:hypothetical protein